MYYISENIKDLESYNDLVNEGENYSGTTHEWSTIVKHFEKDLFSIIVNEKYTLEFETIKNLNGWYKPETL
tara:strand:+ start:245 stop:457 length:213 start_codon:yes stop_codon:yes gene_type:complete